MKMGSRLLIGILSASLLVLLLGAIPGPASGFPTNVAYDRILAASGDGPVVSGDVNGDGRVDALVSDVAGGTVLGFLQGIGGLPASPTFGLSTGPAGEVLLADVDGDLAQDIVVLSGNETRAYLQTDGSFGQRTTTVPSGEARDIAVADLNGDARADVAALETGFLRIWFQHAATPSWSAGADVNLTAAGFHGVLAADLAGDGRPDLVLAKSYELRVYAQTTDGLELNPSSTSLDGFGGYAVPYSGNVDGDGLPDIVIAEREPATGAGRITVYLQRDGTFARSSGMSGSLKEWVALGDLSNDGLTDLVNSESGTSVGVYTQRLTGGFDGAPSFWLTSAGAGAPGGVAVGRFSGRLFADVLVRVPGALLLFEQEDAPPVLVQAIPSEFGFTVGGSGAGLIDLRNYFADDHGSLSFEVVYQERPEVLSAALAPDGYHLDFTPAPGWYGRAQFQVAALDAGSVPVPSNRFTVTVNAPPSFSSSPATEGRVGEVFRYQAEVSDAFPVEDLHAFSLVEAPAGMGIDPKTGLVEWRPGPHALGTHAVRIRVVDSFGGSAEQGFEVVVLPPTVRVPTEAYVAAGGAAAFAALGAGSLASENLKYSLLTLFVPLYSKIKREQVLDHFVRGQIYGYITANPGEHYNAIKLALHLTNGSLAHHLKTLEREDFIKSKRFGLYRRFYPMHFRIPDDGFFAPNEIQKTIVGLIRDHPGITQKEIAEALRLTPPTVNYHVGILSEHRAIRVERAGRKTHCFVTEIGDGSVGAPFTPPPPPDLG